MKQVTALMLATTMIGCAAGAVESPAPTRRLSIEQLIDIKHPSDPVWSPDGRFVAFTWDRAGISNLYVADASAANGTPKQLTSYASGAPGGAFWSRDGQRLYFARGGDLWQVAPSGGEPTAVWTSPTPENGIVASPDVSRVAFVRPAAGATRGSGGSDLWTRSLTDGTEAKVAHDDVSIGNVSWSPDGAHVAYSAGSQSIRHEQTPDYSGVKIDRKSVV